MVKVAGFEHDKEPSKVLSESKLCFQFVTSSNYKTSFKFDMLFVLKLRDSESVGRLILRCNTNLPRTINSSIYCQFENCV